MIFNIKRNSYRLVVKVKYRNDLMLIEWVGTHAEYDKKKFSRLRNVGTHRRERTMNVKTIKSKDDHSAAVARLSALMSVEPKAGSREENELELLALVIEDYERRTVPPAHPDPVEAILFRMDQMNLNRKDLVPYIGSVSKVSEVLSRKRPLSLSMIRRLNKGLGIPAEVLIEDVAADDEIPDDGSLDYRRFPLKEMQERGCFGDFKGSVRRLEDYAEDLIKRWMGDLLPRADGPAFLRAPLHQRGERRADDTALLAWRMCVVRKAREAAPAREYREGSITSSWLRELARLSAFDEGPRLAKEHLARNGVILVIERQFKRTFLDGAAMLDRGRPIVALTLRHDRIDNFWFALLHELAHVAKHLTAERPVFIDDLEHPDNQEMEAEADAIASEALIPAGSWQTAGARETKSSADAIAFAHEIGVHPAIVAGRLRHETGDFRLLSQLIGRAGQVSRHFM